MPNFIYPTFEKKDMPAIGKANPIVDILHQKTKIKKEDITDLLRVLPDSMAEAFIYSNLPPKKLLNLGGVSISWDKTRNKVSFKASKTFRTRLWQLKKEKIID